MHREGEDLVVVLENKGRTVSLMYVEIDYQCTPCETVTLQHAYRDSDVVENAITLAAIGIRVMRAAGEI
jgi:hypothetical protein